MSELPLLILLSLILSLTPLVALFTTFIVSPWQHFYFFSFSSVQPLKTLLAPVLSLAPWVALTTAYLKGVAHVLCFVNNTSLSWSGADRPRSGSVSWRFILLTWVSFDVWGHLRLSDRVLASQNSVCTMCLLYSRGTKWRSLLLLASHFCLSALWCHQCKGVVLLTMGNIISLKKNK